MKIIRQRFRYRPIIAGKAYDFVVFKLRFIARTTYLRIASSCQENYTPFAVCTPLKRNAPPEQAVHPLKSFSIKKQYLSGEDGGIRIIIEHSGGGTNLSVMGSLGKGIQGGGETMPLP